MAHLTAEENALFITNNFMKKFFFDINKIQGSNVFLILDMEEDCSVMLPEYSVDLMLPEYSVDLIETRQWQWQKVGQ